MNYEPAPLPTEPKQLIEYLSRELRRLSAVVRDDTAVVQYRTNPASQGSLTAAVSANFKIAQGNLIRISASATVTLTGLALKIPNRELVLINVGTAAVTLKKEAVESSASYRFALVNSFDLSQNASAQLWYDAYSARWRCIGRT
jgi:hypothetical protein